MRLNNPGWSMSAIVDNAEAQPRARKKPSYSDLFDAADQERIHTDLSTFFGPRPDPFLHTYEKMRSAAGARRVTPRTWCWPVFFGSFTWFFYRKMYAYGAMLIFLPLVFGYLFGSVGGSTSLLFAVWAKGWYVKYALERITKADKLGLTGTERTDYLQRAGGVSLTAGIFAGLIYAFILVVVVLAIAGRHHAHHS
jgi:hypothetical protein